MTPTSRRLGELQDASFAGVNAATAGSFPPERRLSGEAIERYLNSRRNAVVSTTRPDGRPHSAPGAFVLFQDSIWLPVVAKAARIRNVTKQPWVSMVVAEGVRDAHCVVMIEGAAVVATSPPVGLAEAARPKLDSVSWVSSWIHLTPAKLLSYAGPKWEHDRYGEDSRRHGVMD